MVTKLHTAKPSTTKALNGKAPHAGEQIHADHSATSGERVFARYQEAQTELLNFFGAPGWKRALVAFAATCIVAAGVGYIAGVLLNWMLMGAVLASANIFIVIAAYVLGVIAATVYGSKLAARIGGAILTGEADERAIAAYDATRAALAKLNPMRWVSKTSATVH
jgi:hypothetical protein